MEFKYVFVVGAEDGLFPCIPNMNKLSEKECAVKMQEEQKCSSCFLTELQQLAGKGDSMAKFLNYERHERLAGESKYPLKKMLALAVDGITSLSIKPIRFIVFLGFMIFMCSILMLIYSLVQHFLGNTSIGWTSLIVSIWAIGGLQLLADGRERPGQIAPPGARTRCHHPALLRQ